MAWQMIDETQSLHHRGITIFRSNSGVWGVGLMQANPCPAFVRVLITVLNSLTSSREATQATVERVLAGMSDEQLAELGQV